MISLSVGALDIDWGKNRGFVNHSVLFQTGDETEGPYYYGSEEDGSALVETQRCLSRSLARVKPRLELLGYTADSCQCHLEMWQAEDEGDVVSMVAFKRALASLPWRERGNYVHFDSALRAAYAEALEHEAKVGAIADPELLGYDISPDPYLVMRVLADLPEVEDLPVRWNFADLLESGWTTEEEVTPSGPDRRWVVVTEGSSDTFILERSLAVLEPDIADFFDFIDMKEGNPFPGTGNIVAFCRGLSRIRYDGHMLVVLDNDSAGQAARQEIEKLKLPPSFKVACLPDLEELRCIETVGPSGSVVGDINGRASAIECFLDLDIGRAPRVRWTSYEKKLDSYQGELIGKGDYVEDFKRRFGTDPAYDAAKLQHLWRHLAGICKSVAVDERRAKVEAL